MLNYISNVIDSKKATYFIFFLFILKIIFGIYLTNSNPDFFTTEDSESYISPAKHLCEVGRFLNAANDPDTFRTPGFSIILMPAICFDLDLKYYIIFLNSFMVLFTAYFISKILKVMNISLNSKFIYLFFLLDPTLSRYQYNILSEIVFLFIFTVVFYAFILGLSKKNPYYFFGGFVVITIATFIRPITLYLPYFLCIILCMFYIFKKSYRINFRFSLIIASLIGVLFHFLLTELWSHRNYKETGLKAFSYQGTVVLYHYINAAIIAKVEKKDWKIVNEDLIQKSHSVSKQEFYEFAKEELIDNIIKHPIAAIQVGIKGAFMTYLTPGTGQFSKMFNIDKKNYQIANNLFIIYGMIWILIVWIFSSYGFIKIEKNTFFLILAITLVYLTLVSSGPQSYSRYRVPFYPIIALFLSVGIKNFFEKYKSKF